MLFRHSAKALPSARHAALDKEAFAVKGYADSSLPSAALDKGFAECKAFFAALGKARVCCSAWCRSTKIKRANSLEGFKSPGASALILYDYIGLILDNC